MAVPFFGYRRKGKWWPAAGSRGEAFSETAAIAPEETSLMTAACAHCRRSVRLGHWALGPGQRGRQFCQEQKNVGDSCNRRRDNRKEQPAKEMVARGGVEPPTSAL